MTEYQRASESQAAEVLAILKDAALRLRAKGIQQWEEFANGGGESIVKKRFAAGEVYLIRKNGASIGTITLQWEDPFWSGVGEDGKALWVHSLAVASSHTGQKVGEEALRWITEKARGAGRAFVRLDCIGTNEKLCGYYESRGFVQIGAKPWKQYDLRLYQLLIDK